MIGDQDHRKTSGPHGGGSHEACHDRSADSLTSRERRETPLLEIDRISYDRRYIKGQAAHIQSQTPLRDQAREILLDLSLTMNSGEIVALMGVSGAGKSTLLRVIAGLSSISHGEVRLRGRCVQNTQRCDPPESRSLGLMSQSAPLFPHLSVQENIEFGLRPHPVKSSLTTLTRRRSVHGAQSDLNELISALELDELTQRYPQQLSGGQRQRVSLAQTLARLTDLYLWDEPLGHLDPRLRARIAHYMVERCRSMGSAALWVSHELSLALKYADRLAIIDRGQIIAIGTPHQLFHRPPSLVVADLLNIISWCPAQALIDNLSSEWRQDSSSPDDRALYLGFHQTYWTSSITPVETAMTSSLSSDPTPCSSTTEHLTLSQSLKRALAQRDRDPLMNDEAPLYQVVTLSQPLQINGIVLKNQLTGASNLIQFTLLDSHSIKLKTSQPLIFSAYLPTYSEVQSGVKLSLTYRGPLFLMTRGDD